MQVAADAQKKADDADAFRAKVKESCADCFSWEEVRMEAIKVYSLWNVAFEGGARDAAIQHTATYRELRFFSGPKQSQSSNDPWAIVLGNNG